MKCKILILVELANGNVHQVIASPEKKEICLNLLKQEDGTTLLSKRMEPVFLVPHSDENEQKTN
jgi:hypothetical protein